MNKLNLFQESVKRWVQSRDTRRNELATWMETSPSTIDRWWMGISKPHPLFQQTVIRWIKHKDPELLKDLL